MAVGVGHHLPHNRIRPTTHRQRHETRIAAVRTFGPDTKRQVLTTSAGAMNFMRAAAARARHSGQLGQTKRALDGGPPREGRRRCLELVAVLVPHTLKRQIASVRPTPDLREAISIIRAFAVARCWHDKCVLKRLGDYDRRPWTALTCDTRGSDPRGGNGSISPESDRREGDRERLRWLAAMASSRTARGARRQRLSSSRRWYGRERQNAQRAFPAFSILPVAGFFPASRLCAGRRNRWFGLWHGSSVLAKIRLPLHGQC